MASTSARCRSTWGEGEEASKKVCGVCGIGLDFKLNKHFDEVQVLNFQTNASLMLELFMDVLVINMRQF